MELSLAGVDRVDETVESGSAGVEAREENLRVGGPFDEPDEVTTWLLDDLDGVTFVESGDEGQQSVLDENPIEVHVRSLPARRVETQASGHAHEAGRGLRILTGRLLRRPGPGAGALVGFSSPGPKR